jgi:hypothetical protein
MAKVIVFGSSKRILEGALVSNQNRQGPVVPTGAHVPQVQGSVVFHQVTLLRAQIPSCVWTAEGLIDFHSLNEQIALDNNRIHTGNRMMPYVERKRELAVTSVFMGTVVLIVLAGLCFTWKGITGFRLILTGACGFAAALLTGLLWCSVKWSFKPQKSARLESMRLPHLQSSKSSHTRSPEFTPSPHHKPGPQGESIQMIGTSASRPSCSRSSRSRAF